MILLIIADYRLHKTETYYYNILTCLKNGVEVPKDLPGIFYEEINRDGDG